MPMCAEVPGVIGVGVIGGREPPDVGADQFSSIRFICNTAKPYF